MASHSTATVYDSSLNTSGRTQFAPPTTPSRSPFKDASHRRSPTKLLRPTKAVPDYDEFETLLDSDITTSAEKELASRVVQAAEKLKEWCVEIEQWGWSGSFEATMQIAVQSGQSVSDSEDYEFCGSLPQHQVEAFESRLDSIDEDLAVLDVDELKEQILGIHVGRSRPSSSYSSNSFSNLTLYDDFQLFVTETLIFTLPYHSKLKQYLKAWSTRLAVLHEIPSFLRGSKHFDETLNKAWDSLQYPLGPLTPPGHISQVENLLTTAQDELRGKVDELGKQLDRMLDALEDCEDRLPETWIDKFEADEKEYTDWSYEADKKLFQLKMLEAALARKEDTSAFAPRVPSPKPEMISLLSPVPATSVLIISAPLENAASDESPAPEAASTAGSAPVSPTSVKSAPMEQVLTSGDHESQQAAVIIEIEPMLLPVTASKIHTDEAADNQESATILPPIEHHPIGNVLKLSPLVSAEPAISTLATAEATSTHVVAKKTQEIVDSPVMESPPTIILHTVSDGIRNEGGPSHERDVVDAPATESMMAGHPPIVSNGVHAEGGPNSDHDVADKAAPEMTAAELLPFLSYQIMETSTQSTAETPHTNSNNEEIKTVVHLPTMDSMKATHLPIDSDEVHDPDNSELGQGEDEEHETAEMSQPSLLDTDSSQVATIHHFATAAVVRRASVTSIESFSRDKVKTVTLSRRNSNASTIASISATSPPPDGLYGGDYSPIEPSVPKISWPLPPSSPLSPIAGATVNEALRPKTPTHRARPNSSSSLLSSVNSTASEEKELPEDSPLMRVRERPISQAPRPPLNFAMRKRRGFDLTTPLDTSRSISTPFSDFETTPLTDSPQNSPSKGIKSPLSPVVPWEEQISSIVDALPAPIRFRSGPYNSSVARPRDRNASGSQYQPRSRAPTPTLSPLPTLTLAPAEESSSRKPGANEPEIKVYNLISGKDKPIKLFVRRVGENGERVMVRVGGGWADLGEYLRSYAEHHGRRAASDGRIEVVGIGEESSLNATTTPTSRRGSLVSSIGSSALAGTALGNSNSRSASPALIDTPTAVGTPKLNDDYLGTPQTAGSATSAPSRRTSSLWEEPVAGSTGLMGPAIAKKQSQILSEEKTRWVEGVMEQAKRTVGRNVEVGDLGKKGGTRRVFLKGKGVE